MKNFLHNKYRILIFIFCFFLVFSIIFLKKIEPTLENKQFEHFTDSIFTSELSSNTLNLHYTLAHPEKFGIKDYKISLGSMNEKAHSNSFSKLKSNQKRLKNFHYQKLSKENQLTYDILSLEFSTQLSGENFFWLQEPLSPHLGISSQLPILLAEYTFRTGNDIKDYFSLLSCLPDYYNELAEFESQKAKRGLFMSDASLERLLTQCQTMLSSDYLASAFKDKINSLQNTDTLTKKQADSYLSLHEKLIHTCVIPSYQSLSEKLSALKGSEKNDRGLAGFPDGTAYYHYLIQSQVGDFRSTNEIEERLFTQLALDYRQMQTLLSQNPSLAQNLSVFSLSATPEEMLSYLNKAMQTDFPDLDSPKYEVKYVPTSMEEFSSPAFYLTPPADTLSPNTIYINQSSQVNPAELFTTLAHEGFPGHLYQTLYYGNQNPAPIRNLLGCSGYIEGWATYVESISYGYAASYFKVEPELLQLLWQNRSISLCLYSLLDIKIHEYGWTLAQVTQSLHGFGIASDDTCKEIYQYIIENPANYLKYYLGYLNFMDLRDLAEKKAGDKFDKKGFHRFVLETGPAPFPVIEKYVLENY